MNLHELSPAPGSKRASVRVGRGLGSGLGKTSGKGQKGQKSRSGGVKRPGFEGGQKPLYLRLPKRGFYNRFGMNYVEINVGSLNCFEDGTVVEPVMLIEHGMIKNIRDGVRILGNGELTKKLTVQAMGFSKSAEEKIIAAGGQSVRGCQVYGYRRLRYISPFPEQSEWPRDYRLRQYCKRHKR